MIDPVGDTLSLWSGSSVAALGDRDLLDRFRNDRDELAFRAIVDRHGAMVLRACRSILSNSTDADDAFQATFLVLVRRSGSLSDGDRLGPWLHGVARRVALEARGRSRRRRRREVTSDSPPEAGHLDPGLSVVERRETRELIHREVDRLAGAERTAVTLCLLGGLTHQEAADQLGWPLGTVKVRVSRGRERLRGRLLRHDATLTPSGLAALLLGESTAGLVVRPVLVAATVRSAVALAAGRLVAAGLASATVVSLSQGVCRTMIFSQLKFGALVAAAMSGAVVVPALVAYQAPPQVAGDAPRPAATGAAGEPATPIASPEANGRAREALVEKKAETPKPAPRPPVSGTRYYADEATVGLQVRVAQDAVNQILEQTSRGEAVPVEKRLLWYRRLAEAEFAEWTTPNEQQKAVTDYITRLQEYAGTRARAIRANPLDDDNPAWLQAATLDHEIAEAREWYADVAARGSTGTTKAGEKVSTTGARKAWARVEPVAADEKQNRAIRRKLEERIALNFPNDTPLSDLVQYIRQSTRDEAHGLSQGIPIYVDAQALNDVGKSGSPVVCIDLEGIPLRTTLQLALDQLNLGYVVEGGLLLIIDKPTIDEMENAEGSPAARLKAQAARTQATGATVAPGTGGGFR